MFLQAVYRLTIQDFKAALVQHGGWQRRCLQIVGALIILAALPPLLTHQYFQGVLGLLIGSFLAFGTGILAARVFKKETSLQLETKIVVSEEGLVVATARGESKLNWNAFVRRIEAKDIFMLYVQSRMFYIIPKRVFGPEDIISLSEIFSRHISNPSPTAGRLGMQVFLFAFCIATAALLVYVSMHQAMDEILSIAHSETITSTTLLLSPWVSLPGYFMTMGRPTPLPTI